MDTARQLVRWALPGWIAVLFGILFLLVSFLLNGEVDELNFGRGTFLSHMRDLIIPLGVAAIPVGFIIYQVYFWVYWHIPIPSFLEFLVHPKDRGSDILSNVEHIDWEKIFGHRLKKVNPTPFRIYKFLPLIRLKDPRVMDQYQENWRLAEAVWYLSLSDERYTRVANILEKRNQFLGDIYHAMGACTIGLILAFLIYLPANEIFLSNSIFSKAGAASALINFSVTILTGAMFKSSRSDSLRALYQLRRNVITHAILKKPPDTTTEETEEKAR